MRHDPLDVAGRREAHGQSACILDRPDVVLPEAKALLVLAHGDADYRYHAAPPRGQMSTRPRLMLRASFTLAMLSSSNSATRSFSRSLSMVRICSSNTTESRSRLKRAPEISTCVGSFALRIRLVMAATMVVGL